MSVLIRRRDAVQATIDRFNGKTLDFAKGRDCARMTGFHLKKLGWKVPLLKAGLYRSEMGARRVMINNGWDTLIDPVDELLGKEARIAPAMVLIGDVFAVPAPDDQVALFIAAGNGRAFGLMDGVFRPVQPLMFTTAWRAL